MNKSFFIRIIGVVLIILGTTFLGYVFYQSNKKVDTPLVFADRTMLNALWDDYKQVYWESSSGRTLDKQQNDITTSEGQSYTMLRAAWTGDKATFDKTWEFTDQQMQHKQDALFGWKWGKKSDGTYGILTDLNGQNAASDADQDIALALLMAANRWQRAEYRTQAQAIINDIWKKEIVTIDGKPYLAANDLESSSSSETAIINPSYLAPYAYKHFARVDASHDWSAVADSSYDLINRSLSDKLDTANSANIVPDWVLINKKTGALSPATGNLTSNYSYDAMRTPWRLALDWQWNKDTRAKNTLAKFSFLNETYQKDGKIYSTYKHDGTPLVRDEVPAMYGTALGYFTVINPDTAQKIYDQKLKSLYDPTTDGWKDDISYYSDNWAWFGMALYDNALPDLAK